MAVSKWRKGQNISGAELAKLIEIAQADPALAVQVMAEQDTSPAEHRMWSVVWDRLSPVTTVIGVCVLTIGMIAETAENKAFSGDSSPRMYIM